LRPVSFGAVGRALLLLSPAALAGAGIAGLPWPLVAAAALGELAIMVVRTLRRPGIACVGPLWCYDLARLARRGQTIRLRCYYSLLLLAGLYYVYVNWFPGYDLLYSPFDAGLHVSVRDEARFGRSFATALLLLQSAAILVLTPAYLAGAVARERERRTLELLFTTHLQDREIVLGKLFGGLGHMTIFLLTGLPILMVVQVFGGVDVGVIVGGFVATAMSLLSAGSVCILCSVMARRAITAVLGSYAVCFVLFGCFLAFRPLAYLSSPATFVMALEDRIDELSREKQVMASLGLGPSVSDAGTMGVLWPMLIVYVLVHAALALVYTSLAVRRMRQLRREEQCGPLPATALPGVPRAELLGGWDPVVPLALPAEPIGAAESKPERPILLSEAAPGESMFSAGAPQDQTILLAGPPEPDSPAPSYDLPPIGQRPFLWKETYVGGVINTLNDEGFFLVVWVAGLLLALVTAADFLYGYLEDPERTFDALQNKLDPGLRALAVFLAAVCCIFVAFRAASSVGRERDRRTLDLLLTLPVERKAILGAKWVGTILRCRFLGYLLAGLWAFGLLSGTFHPMAVPFLAVACAAHVAFFASLGIWLGVVFRKTVVAHMALALVMLTLFTMPWLVEAGTGWITSTSGYEAAAPPASRADGARESYVIGLNPGWTTWALGFSWEELDGLMTGPYRREFLVTERAALAGVAVYAVLAGALWLLACRHFRRSPRPAWKARPAFDFRVKTVELP
jgi:ABC-type Na+ efflux pump permease subunit